MKRNEFLNRILKRTLCLFIAGLVLCGNTAMANDGLNLGNITLEGKMATSSKETPDGTAPEPQSVAPSISYNKYELSTQTKNFLASVDGNITLTLFANELDYSCGEYNEYYYDFYASENTYYRTVIDLLKTVSEWSDNINLVFLDPFSVSAHSFMTTHEDFEPKYGDIFISCHTNFDGSARTRYDLIPQDAFFGFETDQNGLNKITSLKLESVLIEKLYELRTSRDINVALISDINGTGSLDYLKTHLDGRGYKLDNITLENEKLFGYDMIIIASPIRDVTLEEIVLIDTFLSHENKSIMYFAPETYVGLNNLYQYFSKWGVVLEEESLLYTSDTGGYFSSHNQLYAKSKNTEYTKAADELGAFYIMNNCTPIKALGGIEGVSVDSLLETNSKKVKRVLKPAAIIDVPTSPLNSNVYENTQSAWPLATVCTKGTSKITVFSSVDFIDSYFALQIKDSIEDFGGNTNGNLEFTANLLESLNLCHRSEVSGLAEYAVSLTEKGYDTTSGLKTDNIMFIALSLGALFILLMIVSLFIFNRRKKNARK